MKLKVMTFNIQHGRNHNFSGDVIDLDAMVQNICEQQPDICGLNEVRKGENLDHKSGFSDQTSYFSECLGYDAYFANAIIKENYIYGNAILSKTPIVKCEKIMIPDVIERVGTRYETRCIIKSEYDYDGKKLTVLNTHFGLGVGEDVNAVDTVVSLLSHIDGPVVLMGDFNKTPDDVQIKRISAIMTDVHEFVGKDELTFPSDAPEIRIDYIFVRDAKVLNADTVKKVISDHYAITAEIEI